MTPSPDRHITVVAEGFSFLEAPRWREGALYVSDFYTKRVLSFDAEGRMERVCTVEGQPSGLGFTPNGEMLIVSMLDRRLLRLTAGELVEFADLSSVAPASCNDLLVDDAGGAYVGNFGWDPALDLTVQPTCLIRVAPDGSATIAADDLVFPNGAVLTPDRRTLLISETFASRISAFDVASDGKLSNRRAWAEFGDPGKLLPDTVASGLPLPDGMALDAEGAIWIGDAAGPGAHRVTEGGEIVETVETGELSVYAVALGGEDRRTLYMCASPPLLRTNPAEQHLARLLSCRVDVPGAGLP